MPNDRREVLQRPRQQLVVGRCRASVRRRTGRTTAAPARRCRGAAPLARRQRDRLGVQPFSGGDQHAGVLRAAASRRAAPARPPPTRPPGSGGAAAALRGATCCDEAGQPRRGHGEHHRVGCQSRALVVDQAQPRAVARSSSLHRDVRPAQPGPPDERVEQDAGSRRRRRRTPGPGAGGGQRPRDRLGQARAPRSSAAASVGTAARMPMVAADPA